MERQQALPSRFQYPGAPLPRWWQIEDARVDIGGYPPDRSHFATMLLLDLVLSHSDDWFTFPVRARMGHVVTLHKVMVTDTFGESWEVKPPQEFAPPDPWPAEDWSLFAVAKLGPRSLVLWPTVATPLAGEAIEEVVLGVDEDANAMWAVEERARGQQLTMFTPDRAAVAPPNPFPPGYEYVPSTAVPQHWHPYVIGEGLPRRRFVQGRLMDYSAPDGPKLRPEPLARLLYDERAPATAPVHQIEPSTVPTQGLRLDRRWVMGRCTTGAPILWVQRRRQPLLAPPVSGLRFDALRE
jgi:hypothetical protein